MSSTNIENERLIHCSSVQKLANSQDQSESSILMLPELPMLKIFNYLNLKDSINLSMTCVTIYRLRDLVLKQREFDLVGCEIRYNLQDIESHQLEKFVIKNNISSIGHVIHNLSIYFEEIDETVMENCVNVESLRLYSSEYLKNKEGNDFIVTCQRNAWIQQLKLKSLWFVSNVGFMLVLSGGVTNLKELRIDETMTQTITSLLRLNPTIERLSICVDNKFDFRLFRNLQTLQCLHIFMHNDIFKHRDDIDDTIEFMKVDGLTEFSFGSYINKPRKLHSFLQSLAVKTNLEKLMIILPYVIPDAGLVSALKLFNVSALDLEFDDAFDDYTQFIQEIPSPRLKYLKLRNCSKASFEMVVTQWKSVETICLHQDFYDDPIWDKEFYKEILKLNVDRQMLRLNVTSSRTSRYIEFCFKSQQLKMKDFSGCVNKHVFQFQADDCNLY